MSRITNYQDNKLTVVSGLDHVLGKFIQMYDRDMEEETPEGEGLVLDWSEGFGTSTNYTGNPVTNDETSIWSAVSEYIVERNPRQCLVTGLQTMSLN